LEETWVILKDGSPTTPTTYFRFIEECAENKAPAFISVQPEKDKAQPLGIEKVFFDFDFCKKSDLLAEAEIQKRKSELRDEVKYFLKQLGCLNIKPLVIRNRRGFHVHVFFDSVYEINQDLEFWKQVYRQLQLALLQDHDYRFIDYAVVGDINRMCSIPFSIHEKSGEECVVVNGQLEEDKVRSVEYIKLYGLKQKDILAAMDRVHEFSKALKEKE
jgi:DNA primase catalytic subunit